MKKSDDELVRFSVIMPVDLLKRLDREAAGNRSKYIVETIQARLEKEDLDLRRVRPQLQLRKGNGHPRVEGQLGVYGNCP